MICKHSFYFSAMKDNSYEEPKVAWNMKLFFIRVLSWQVSIRSVEPLGNSLNNFLYKRLLRTIWYYRNISLSICTLHNTNVQNDLNNILHKTSNGLYVSADLPQNFNNKRCFSFNLYSWHAKNFFPMCMLKELYNPP